MVNLDQAWAENYRTVKPDVSVQVAGGGSGVGIAGLIDGILDIAASSRKMEPGEIEKATKSAGAAPREIVVGLDALPCSSTRTTRSRTSRIEDLAQIYGDGGTFTKWSQLGVRNTSCAADEIIRVSRQNNSGTYAYFREAVLGRTADFKLGSVDQSGSKDVAALVARTPCAIGYSGMAYIVPGVHALKISKKKGETPIEPTVGDGLERLLSDCASPLLLHPRRPVGAGAGVHRLDAERRRPEDPAGHGLRAGAKASK